MLLPKEKAFIKTVNLCIQPAIVSFPPYCFNVTAEVFGNERLEAEDTIGTAVT